VVAERIELMSIGLELLELELEFRSESKEEEELIAFACLPGSR
jgi:hypothetical protein